MGQVKRVVIRAYDDSNAENTDISVVIEPATGTNNLSRVKITLSDSGTGDSVSTSLNIAELQTALGVVD